VSGENIRQALVHLRRLVRSAADEHDAPRRSKPHHYAGAGMNRPLLTFMIRRGRRFESLGGLTRVGDD
jgi:hypothetical protein